MSELEGEDVGHHVTLLPGEVLANSPSKRDGVGADDEMAQRVWGCELIMEAGILLRLPQVVMCTAQNLFHRFYYRVSLLRFDAFLSAMGCFFLACKIEEKPKRIREVLMVFHFTFRVRCRSTATLELGGVRYNGWKSDSVRTSRGPGRRSRVGSDTKAHLQAVMDQVECGLRRIPRVKMQASSGRTNLHLT